MKKLTVVYDACVLYPAPLRDLLMWLAMTDLFQAKWTNKIHEEWMRNVLKNRPDLTLAQLDRAAPFHDRTKQLMNSHIKDALVTGYEYLIPSLTLPDADDIHVLATAIHGKADLILTFNLKDFPDFILTNYKIYAIHPDEFILELIDIAETIIIQAISQHRMNLKNPPLTIQEYLNCLSNQGLIETVEVLKEILL
ncbi:PIN domain-containing protein [Geminocystis herdmanii]|uniref:PIN domain-containing protein n=1 Tax=Geminocystis herdmanii TaxID=669359 RepID=UPI000349713B|nr:PIN domain-containing protein [Geminocystis herdmanii]